MHQRHELLARSARAPKGALTDERGLRTGDSHRGDSNPEPAVYKTEEHASQASIPQQLARLTRAGLAAICENTEWREVVAI